MAQGLKVLSTFTVTLALMVAPRTIHDSFRVAGRVTALWTHGA